MTPDPREYTVNHDWIWSLRRKKAASLRVTLTHPERGVARRRCDLWLAGLTHDDGNSVQYWGAGWAVDVEARSDESVVLVLSSSGEDSADSLQYAAQSLFASVIAPDPLVGVTWEELPLTR